jgi:hypothetical protein
LSIFKVLKPKKMSHLATTSKISNYIHNAIGTQVENWTAMLHEGNLLQFEEELSQTMAGLYNFVCEELLPEASAVVVDDLVRQGKTAGGRKIEVRPFALRIATGRQIKVKSPYVKQVPEDWRGSRHLLCGHWGIIGGASPALYDKVGFCCALGPSHDFAHQALEKFGVRMCLSSVREVANRLAYHCFDYGEEKLMLAPDETLAGKRVVLSVDGGRTRTRIYDGQVNTAGQLTYQTAWCEPKLFVIDILNDEGQPDRYELPIYGCRFKDTDVLELLERYLKRLRIDKAAQVQLLADGAPWIWTQVKELLLHLGLDPARLIETLDYYHASQYVHKLVDDMPKRIGKKQRNGYLKQFKDWLWQGHADKIVRQCRQIYLRPNKIVKQWLDYLCKHQDKTQYATFQECKLMCGSGIIESGIRRIINLRFKNASTFWDKETVERFYFLRAALLSKRWDLVIQNLSNST